MTIYTRVIMCWDDRSSKYVTTEQASFDYSGPVAMCCGASSQQTDSYNQQSSLTKQFTQQSQEVFGNDSKVFNDLMATFAPTVAAGPNQQGFSAAEKSNLDSQAITNTGVAYKNAKAAVGNAQSAVGGGNTGLTDGGQIAQNIDLASSAANQTSSQLGQINQADWETGRKNYDTAVAGLEGAGNVYNSASAFDSAATNSGEAQASTANQIASQNNSWVQGVTGALGGIAGGALGGWMSGLKQKSTSG